MLIEKIFIRTDVYLFIMQKCFSKIVGRGRERELVPAGDIIILKRADSPPYLMFTCV